MAGKAPGHWRRFAGCWSYRTDFESSPAKTIRRYQPHCFRKGVQGYRPFFHAPAMLAGASVAMPQ